MPSFQCLHPTCTAILDARGYCVSHSGFIDNHRADRQQNYDRYSRNPAAKKFYNSSAWKNARAEKLLRFPICERCKLVMAEHVHHIKPLADCTPEESVDQSNLMCVCVSCHNIVEAEAVHEEGAVIRGMLHVVEDDEFYFDEEKADRAVRFIQKFCRHYEGRFAGQPFNLLEWQKHFVRTIFGWHSRVTGLRRFKEAYLIAAKGAGKTPLLTGIGLYMLLGDGEAGAHVISMASTFEQANLTFDAGKKYIAESPHLSKNRAIQVKQFIINGPKYGKWTTISGKPTGRSGPRPSCVIADEAHEWEAATARAYDLLIANLFKRAQPLLLVATNAGADRSCFARQLHERAMGVLSGEIQDKTLFPVIYEASPDLDWRSEEAARQANPSLGSIVSFDQLRPELGKGEKRYRRLYLSQWVTGSDKWIDTDQFDACVAAFDREAVADLPLYVGLDASQSDDLCAASFVWASPKKYYVDTRFWLPRSTADRYESKENIPYSEWEGCGDINLLEENTISLEVQHRIAEELIAIHAVTPIKAVCYDRAYSSVIIAKLESSGITCVPIGQGWAISPGCNEFDRRLKEKSIQIMPNGVMKFCVGNVEIKRDERGNYWPVKPGATQKSTGKRAMKIDGVTSLVTCLTVARKHDFPKAPENNHVGALIVEL